MTAQPTSGGVDKNALTNLSARRRRSAGRDRHHLDHGAGRRGHHQTSLRVPLSMWAGFEAGCEVVFYASTPGSLVDLAAELGWALKLNITWTGAPRRSRTGGRSAPHTRTGPLRPGRPLSSEPGGRCPAVQGWLARHRGRGSSARGHPGELIDRCCGKDVDGDSPGPSPGTDVDLSALTARARSGWDPPVRGTISAGSTAARASGTRSCCPTCGQVESTAINACASSTGRTHQSSGIG